jgi:hypothetical protein
MQVAWEALMLFVRRRLLPGRGWSPVASMLPGFAAVIVTIIGIRFVAFVRQLFATLFAESDQTSR